MALRIRVVLCSAMIACGGGDDPTEKQEQVPSPDELGPFIVGHASFTPVDASRDDRSLRTEVWYPVDETDTSGVLRTEYDLIPGFGLQSEVAYDDLPVSDRAAQTLIVFSHGYGGINIQSIDLMESLASHGFVVVSPEHTGNAQDSMTDDFDQAAANRVPDVSFLIDTMMARSADAADDFYDRLDPDEVGVIGHSFGGMTAIGSAAGWAGAQPDPRVVAIAPISAVIDGDLQSDEREGDNSGFADSELATIDVPVLLVGGTEDVDVPIENNQLAFDGLSNAPVVYKVDVVGANHTHFANVCDIGDLMIEMGLDQDSWVALGAEDLIIPYETTCGPDAFPVAEAIRLSTLYAVAFFKHHIHGEAGYGDYLTTDHAKQEPDVVFSLR